MANPALTYLYPVDGSTNISAAFLVNLQQNIVTYVSQFIPLIGGQLAGALLWDPTQTFPSSQVTISNPTSYQQTGFYSILDDHINDPIHGAPVLPLNHAASHELGGSDMLFGNLVSIASGSTTDIKSYVDTKVASVSGSFYSGPPASSRYEISGADPLYGNLIAIDSSHPSLDIETFVNNSVTAAIASGVGSNNPTFNTIALSQGLINTSNGANLSISSQGEQILVTDGSNTSILTQSEQGVVNFGQSGADLNQYGTLSANGYAIGQSIFGPTGLIVNGPAAANGDITATRTGQGAGTQGALFLGNSGLAYLSYNTDVQNQFFFSQPLTLADDLSIDPGSQLNIGNTFYIGPNIFNTIAPGIASDGTNIHLFAKDTGNIYIGYDNSVLSAIYFGPLGAWGSLQPNGLTMGSTNVSASGATIAGTVSVNSAYVPSNGDLGVARGPSSGRVGMGQSNSTGAYIDYGIANSATFTFGINNTTVNAGILSQIESDGTYSVGDSLYGPTSASVNGPIAALKTISAALGIDTTGNSGFTFGTDYTTGLFSGGGGDIQLFSGGSSIFDYVGGIALFTTNVSVSGAFNTTGNNTFASDINVGGDLILSGDIQAVGTTISAFRVKGITELFFTSGVVATGTTTKFVPMPAFVGGQIENLRLTATASDSGVTSTSFTIYKNGVALGTVTLPAGLTHTSTLPNVNPTPVATGDLIQAICVNSGGATGVSVFIETSQLVY